MTKTGTFEIMGRTREFLVDYFYDYTRPNYMEDPTLYGVEVLEVRIYDVSMGREVSALVFTFDDLYEAVVAECENHALNGGNYYDF